jgi:hypothetical protein
METVLNSLQTHTATLYVVALFISFAGLLTYANRRISIIHRWEKQANPHRVRRFHSLYNLFFLSYAGGFLSFVVLARWASLPGLVAAIVVAGVLFSGLNRFLTLTWQRLGRQVRSWRWSVPLRPVRVGLLGASGLGLTCFVEEEYLVSSLLLTGDPSGTSGPVTLSLLSQIMTGPFLNGLATLALFVLGSAFCRATVQLQAAPHSSEKSIYSWRTDSLLVTYLMLLVLQFGLTALIAFSSISVYTFWIAYAGVAVGQLTPAGRRGGERLLYGVEFLLRVGNRPAH